VTGPEQAEGRPARAAGTANTFARIDSITAAEYLTAVEHGIHSGIVEAFRGADIHDAVRKGVWESFPYAAELKDAVYFAVKNAMDES